MPVRSYPSPKVRGGDRERQAATVQEQPRGATSEVRGGGLQELPHVQGAAAAQLRRADRNYSMFKVWRGGLEEKPSSKVRSSGCAFVEQP